MSFRIRILLTFALIACVECATLPEEVLIAVSKACQLYMKIEFPATFNESLDLSMVYYSSPNAIPQNIPLANASERIAQSPDFDAKLQTVIILHGFNDGPESTIPATIAETYLETKKHNVLALDASRVTHGQYPRSAYLSEHVGRALAEFVRELVALAGVDPARVHLVGMSLGAQTAGWAGRIFRQRLSDKPIGRITGLDPAGPCFERVDHGRRLYEDDAEYVDVVHANQGVQGIIETVGRADFFPNGGGPHQPGCSEPNCSHQRAALLYLASLRDPNLLLGRRCASWERFEDARCNENPLAVMGFHSSEKTRGKYYFKTSAAMPYGLGLDGATVNKKRESRWARNFRNWFGG